MIPHKSDRNVIIGGIDNATQFSIATTGKAFRVLIDNLYSDKILAPVRELITNAVDAHVAAGNDAPFRVLVPTIMDPTFGVRDFGTGMDHETIVGLYTTLFASSKDDSNEQTGMLGLGSKSPFAYTDTFTVEAFDGATKRVYMAYIENEIPSLSQVAELVSDEPRGIFVKFPVQTHDRRDFVRAIYKVMAGLDTLPELDGEELDTDRLPQVLRQGNGWRIVTTEPTYGENNQSFLRQGSVLYRLRNSILQQVGFPEARYSSTTAWVFDAPIGTADVTPSREELSYDDETVANLKQLAKDAWQDFYSTLKAEAEACTSQYERQQLMQSVPGAVREWLLSGNMPGDVELFRQRFDLYPGHFKAAAKWTQEEMQKAKLMPELFPQQVKAKQMVTHIDSHLVFEGRVRFVLDDGVSPRRRSRMLAWAESGPYNGYLMIPASSQQAAIVKRLKSLLQLDDEHFIPVNELPDNPVARKAGTVVKLSEIEEALANGAHWVEKDRVTITFRNEDGHVMRDLHMDYWKYTLDDMGLTNDDVVFVTPSKKVKLMESGVLTWDNSFNKLLVDKAQPFVDALVKYHMEWDVRRALQDAGCSHPSQLTKHLGYPTYQPQIKPDEVRYVANQLASHKREKISIQPIVKAARAAYPALFPILLDDSAVKDYLVQQDQTTNNTEEVSS